MYIQGIIIIEDSVLVQSFAKVNIVPLKTKLAIMSFFMRNANCVTNWTIPVAFDAIPVECDAGNLLLSGTVHVQYMSNRLLLHKL